jgi:hypothetical protein
MKAAAAMAIVMLCQLMIVMDGKKKREIKD